MVAGWASGVVVHSKREEDAQNLLAESRLPNTRGLYYWCELRIVHCDVEVPVICADSFDESAQGLGDIFINPCFLLIRNTPSMYGHAVLAVVIAPRMALLAHARSISPSLRFGSKTF